MLYNIFISSIRNDINRFISDGNKKIIKINCDFLDSLNLINTFA